jgi:hypothetical protein
VDEERNSSTTKEIIDSAKGLVESVPIYNDLIQPAAKELGSALGTLAKTVHVALAPVSVLVWGYEKIKNFVSTEVLGKLERVRPEDIESPNPSVVGPALEALKYTGHDANLRNMYANLLANALDKNTKPGTHPSFVEIIKQLSPAEAVLLSSLSQRKEYPLVVNYSRKESSSVVWNGIGSFRITSNKVIHMFDELCLELDLDINAKSALDNFRRLQLLDVETTIQHKTGDGLFGEAFENLSKDLELGVYYHETLRFSEFGTNFIGTCVEDKI